MAGASYIREACVEAAARKILEAADKLESAKRLLFTARHSDNVTLAIHIGGLRNVHRDLVDEILEYERTGDACSGGSW